jgi:Putative aminopeptidase
MLLARGATANSPPDSAETDRKDLVSAVKHLERKLGFRGTKNFRKASGESAVAYRCYYTGKLELPDSYEKLRLIPGTKAGCPLDTAKYDVFFYPMDANASGKTPISAGLAQGSVERLLVVVPHEDFHASKALRNLLPTLSEAAATLVGFLTAREVARQHFGADSEVYKNLQREPELFYRKAEMVNRYFVQLSRLYAARSAGGISEPEALAEKQRAFEEMQRNCKAIDPPAKSFNECLSAPNNAGLAFDETYTKYYPIMYDVYRAKGEELKPTFDALQGALSDQTEAEALHNLQALTGKRSAQ